MSSCAPWPCMRMVSASISVGPPPRAGSLAGLRGGLEHRLHVIAVHLDAREAVACRPLDWVDGELERVRRRVSELVVLQHEHHGQAAYAGHVHRLVPYAVGGGPVAEPGHGHSRLAAHLEREAQPAGHQRHVGQHRDHPDAAKLAVAEVHVAVLARRRPSGAPHHLSKHPPGTHAADQMGAEVAVQDACAVAGAEREGRAHRHGLLAATVVEAAWDLALAGRG